jgi:hypothetical protein
VTLWHKSRDSHQELAALEPFKGVSVRVRPQVFALKGSVTAIHPRQKRPNIMSKET